MCRWLAYSGSPLLIEDILYKPAHSLIAQSLHSHARSRDDQRRRVRNRLVRHRRHTRGLPLHRAGLERPQPPRAGGPHRVAARSSRTSAPRPASPVQQTNCHPFRHGRWLWMHNGVIREFAEVKRDLVLAVDPSLYPHIEGSTDSEVFFFLALTLGLEDDPPGAVARAVGLIEEIGRRARRRAPDPDDGRDHGREERLGVPLLQRARFAVALLLDRRADAAASAPGARGARRR